MRYYLHLFLCIFIFKYTFLYLFPYVYTYFVIGIFTSQIPVSQTPTMSLLGSRQIRRNAAFPYFLIQRGRRVVEGSQLCKHLSFALTGKAALLLTYLHTDIPLPVKRPLPGRDLSDYLDPLTLFAIGEPEAQGH